jgi:hypothetical protein
MKSFKEYLTESKKVYEFKVKIAGDVPADCNSKIKGALAQFCVGSVSSGKSTPIQERQTDFPAHKNVSVTVYDITTDYPATSLQIRDKIAEQVGILLSDLMVRNLKEEEEYEVNHAHDVKTGKAFVGTDYEASNHQEIVGEKHTMNLLKELGKVKHQPEPVTGTNDQLFPSGVPETDKQPMSTKVNVKSEIGTRQVKLTPVAASTHNSLNVPKKGKK